MKLEIITLSRLPMVEEQVLLLHRPSQLSLVVL